MSAVRLSQEQVAQFEEEGFVVVRGFIPADLLNELRQGYDAATRGELDVDVWKEKIGPERILQLGMPNKYIPGWEGHEYQLVEGPRQVPQPEGDREVRGARVAGNGEPGTPSG